MANLIRKLTKTSASLTLFSNITHHPPILPIPKPPPPSSLSHFPKHNVDYVNGKKLQFWGDDKLDNSQSIHLFPSCSHGVFLNPAVNSIGYENQRLQIGVTDSDFAATIWADSVKKKRKKKRKKKMNKHKYKKLRKRLRRKT